jgi:hypothetical protein
MEARGTIMTSGLPLDFGDLGVLAEVIQGLFHPLAQCLGVDTGEKGISDKGPTVIESNEKQLSKAGHLDSACDLSFGS